MEHLDCVQECLLARIDFMNALGDFARADNDFWDFTLSGRSYLNHLPGGPQDLMQRAFYNMRMAQRRYTGFSCRRYL
jgi:hypothetical protein